MIRWLFSFVGAFVVGLGLLWLLFESAPAPCPWLDPPRCPCATVPYLGEGFEPPADCARATQK